MLAPCAVQHCMGHLGPPKPPGYGLPQPHPQRWGQAVEVREERGSLETPAAAAAGAVLKCPGQEPGHMLTPGLGADIHKA